MLVVKLVVQIVAVALEVPGHETQLVKALDARLVTEQVGRRVLARPVVRPGEAALDQALVDGVEKLVRLDHGAVG